MDRSTMPNEEPIFRTAPIELVQEGMAVFDSLGDRIGDVEYVQMGDPEAITTEGNEYETPGVIRDVVRSVVGSEPQVPEPLRSQLLRYGFVKIDGPGLTDTDRYVRGDRIARVEGDRVTLSVARDQLMEEV